MRGQHLGGVRQTPELLVYRVVERPGVLFRAVRVGEVGAPGLSLP